MKTNKPWGQILILDLHNCDKDILKNQEKLKEFCSELCKKIKMETFGEPLIKRFGEGELEGNSLMQFIETSSITIHADEFGDRVFIDVFSCKGFDSQIAEEFSKEFFNTNDSKSQCIYRG